MHIASSDSDIKRGRGGGGQSQHHNDVGHRVWKCPLTSYASHVVYKIGYHAYDVPNISIEVL